LVSTEGNESIKRKDKERKHPVEMSAVYLMKDEIIPEWEDDHFDNGCLVCLLVEPSKQQKTNCSDNPKDYFHMM